MGVADGHPASRVAARGQRPHPRHHPLLGGLLVKEGLINRAQLHRVLLLQQEREPRPLLGQMLLDEKLITSHELSTVLSKYERKHLLGNVLIETKAVTPSQLEAALAAHRKTDGHLGHVLIQLGFITERQLKHALSIQLGIPILDLDEIAIDPAVASLISEHYARHHRVIPIAKVDERILLAMDDPTDVEVVAEVRACIGHPVDVVTATATVLDRALARVYGDRSEGPAASTARGDADDAAKGEAVDPTTPAGPEDRGGGVLYVRGAERPRRAVALDAIRTRITAIRQAARAWEREVDTLEALLRQRAEHRAEIERLAGKVRECRAALAQAYQELDAKAQALETLERTQVAALHDREVLARSLQELQDRHDALLRDREFAIERISAILGRLRPGV